MCVAAAEQLAGAGVAARVVSLPSWDRFAEQGRAYRDELLPPGVPVLSVEAASTFGWGPVRRRLDRHRPLRSERAGRIGAGEVGYQRRQCGVERHAHWCRGTRDSRHCDTGHWTQNGAGMTDRLKVSTTSRVRARGSTTCRRGYLTSGELAALRDRGVRGLTSNPSIFQKAIQDSVDYDDQFADTGQGGRRGRRRLLVARHPGHPRRVRRVRTGLRRVGWHRRLRQRRGGAEPGPRRAGHRNGRP